MDKLRLGINKIKGEVADNGEEYKNPMVEFSEWEEEYKAPNGEIYTGDEAYENAYADFLNASKDLENYEIGSEGHKRHHGYLTNALDFITKYWKSHKM